MISRLRRDDGFTTTEMIVAMAIGTVLGAMTLFVVLGLSKASEASIERSQSATIARTALDSWNSLLAVRESPTQDEASTPSIECMTDDSITFYSAIDNRPRTGGGVTSPTRIELKSSDGGVVEHRFDPTSDEEATTRLLVPNGSLTLRAYRADGRPVDLPLANGASYSVIDRVTIEITVRDEQGRSYTYGGANDVPSTAE